MTITAKVIAHSRPSWADGASHDLFTLELKYPRFIHSQLLTHRVFSRNASSSRAIPVQRVIDAVACDPVLPVHWGANRPGMQAREELNSLNRDQALDEWLGARLDALEHAERMAGMGVHKQIVNRLLEPWSHITVLVTATEWSNFFQLRDHSDAQPEVDALAGVMRAAMQESEPTIVRPGEWLHLPYCATGPVATVEERLASSVAGCARVSYGRHDGGQRSLAEDAARALLLQECGHWSPFEHQATPMRTARWDGDVRGWPWEDGVTHLDRSDHYWSGNLRGWIQHRQLVMVRP